MTDPAVKLAFYDQTDEREFALAVAALARRAKAALRACGAWFLVPPKLPTYPPIDYSQEPGAARAVRLRRIQAAVDDLLAPPGPDDFPHTSARY
jgi:hypothetical protein